MSRGDSKDGSGKTYDAWKVYMAELFANKKAGRIRPPEPEWQELLARAQAEVEIGADIDAQVDAGDDGLFKNRRMTKESRRDPWWRKRRDRGGRPRRFDEPPLEAGMALALCFIMLVVGAWALQLGRPNNPEHAARPNGPRMNAHQASDTVRKPNIPISIWVMGDADERVAISRALAKYTSGRPEVRPSLMAAETSDDLMRLIWVKETPDLAVVDWVALQRLVHNGSLRRIGSGEVWLPLADPLPFARPMGIVVFRSSRNPETALALADSLHTTLTSRSPRSP